MKTLFKKFETMMIAASFAEEGEFNTAKEMLRTEARREARKEVRKILRAE